jgi:hypothetical protein
MARIFLTHVPGRVPPHAVNPEAAGRLARLRKA